MTIYARSILTTETRIIGINHLRTSLVIQNTHATAYIYISDAQGVTATTGLRIAPNATISLKIPEDDPTQAWWAIASATATSIVYEGFGK